MRIEPLADRVLVLPAEAETKTKGGLYIPETAKEVPAKGRVIAVGPGREEIPMTLKEGDEVMYSKYAGVDIEEDGISYKVMRETDVIARLKPIEAPDRVDMADGTTDMLKEVEG